MIVWPRPPHCGHVRSIEKKPWLARTRPEPEHMAQVVGCVPGLAPEPEHSSQVTAVGTRICAVRPLKASSSVISML